MPSVVRIPIRSSIDHICKFGNQRRLGAIGTVGTSDSHDVSLGYILFVRSRLLINPMRGKQSYGGSRLSKYYSDGKSLGLYLGLPLNSHLFNLKKFNSC